MVTFGQSFQWTDRLRTAEVVYDLLEPGGSMVLISHSPNHRPAPPRPADTALIPHAEIRRLLRSFLRPDRGAGAGPASSQPGSSNQTERFDETLERTRFGRPRVVFAAGRPDIVRDADSVIAGYLSMSFAAPPCSVHAWASSWLRCARCWRSGRREVGSGTGPATPRWSSRPGPDSEIGVLDGDPDNSGATASSADEPECVRRDAV